jgi:multiple sugar transport system substrate-binding protein
MTLLKRTGVVVATLSLLSLAACGNDDADTTEKSSGPVTIQFWSWAPGYEDSVKLFNDSHKDIHVDFHQISPGSQGGYTKLLNAAKAGNAPCLAQVGFETLPSFAAAGALEDATDEADQYAGDFSDWTWSQSTIAGHTYAIPVDIAPMALIYRKDLFEKYGVTKPPATWDEYAADAATIHKANPKAYLGYFGNDAYNFAGLAWQAGAKWFGTEGDSWQVSVNDDATKKVADFWQGLVDKDLVKAVPSFDTALYKGMGDGTILSDVNAVWDAPIVADSVKGTSGKWAVAPMPVWEAADPSYGNAGGSPNAVLKGCDHVAEAVEFAHWFSTDQGSVTNLIQKTGIYPAATSGLSNPELTKPNPFYGGQVIFDIFNDAVAGIDPAFTWGPVMTKTSAVLGDGLGKVGAKSTTLPSVLDDAQTQTVDEMKAQGLSVSE